MKFDTKIKEIFNENSNYKFSLDKFPLPEDFPKLNRFSDVIKNKDYLENELFKIVKENSFPLLKTDIKPGVFKISLGSGVMRTAKVLKGNPRGRTNTGKSKKKIEIRYFDSFAKDYRTISYFSIKDFKEPFMTRTFYNTNFF